ncbi:MAG: hypothetical protein U1C33_01160, partial [Candidatus Cloacimonadaceae bacterium]|nr:hypothetical protein [Candidatus Cloacimonadaceae bacterium]
TNLQICRARNVSQVHEFFQRIRKYLVIRATSSNPNIVPDDSVLTPDDQNDFDSDNDNNHNGNNRDG